jgi:hypothetical protein
MAVKRKASPTQNDDGEVVVQLATRIPRQLQKRLKLHSVETNVSISDFVAGAIEAALDAAGTGKRKAKAA